MNPLNFKFLQMPTYFLNKKDLENIKTILKSKKRDQKTLKTFLHLCHSKLQFSSVHVL